MAQDRPREFGEEALDEIEPRTMLGREGKLEASRRSSVEPGSCFSRYVRGMIIEDQLDRGAGRIGGIEKLGAEGDSNLGDLIEDQNTILPIDTVNQSNLRDTTTRVLALLTPREERIVRMRFGIGINSDHTLEQVGQQFSVTRERIRQIEAKALRKLKHPSRSIMLRSFLNS